MFIVLHMSNTALRLFRSVTDGNGASYDRPVHGPVFCCRPVGDHLIPVCRLFGSLRLLTSCVSSQGNGVRIPGRYAVRRLPKSLVIGPCLVRSDFPSQDQEEHRRIPVFMQGRERSGLPFRVFIEKTLQSEREGDNDRSCDKRIGTKHP
jgi:hypothetical protein